MKLQTIVLLAFALGCGLVAMVGVQQALSGNSSSVAQEQVRVLIAREDLNAGTKLTEMNVDWKTWPANAVPEGAITSVEQYENRAVKSDTFAGDMLSELRLGEKGVYGASMGCPKGFRLLTIPVDATKSHSGMLGPHDRVDVTIAYEISGTNGRGRIKKAGTLLEYVEVFAAGAKRTVEGNKADEQKVTHVTLILTPEQVEFITLAQSKGTISLSMRNKEDKTLRLAKGMDENLLDRLSGALTGEHKVPTSDLAVQNGYSDGNDTTHPEDEENENSSPVDAPEALTDFLNNDNDDASDEVAVVEEEKKWSIKIFSGETIVEQQFELPQPKQETSALKTLSSKVKSTKIEDRSDSVKAVLPLLQLDAKKPTEEKKPVSTEQVTTKKPQAEGAQVTDFLKSLWGQKSKSAL